MPLYHIPFSPVPLDNRPRGRIDDAVRLLKLLRLLERHRLPRLSFAEGTRSWRPVCDLAAAGYVRLVPDGFVGPEQIYSAELRQQGARR